MTTERDPEGIRHRRVLGDGKTRCGRKPGPDWVGAPTAWDGDCETCFALSHGSSFTGIGGIDLACERAGFTSTWQIEIDKAARSVLARHWKDVPRYDDITGITDLPRVALFSGGVPCQDWSVAGKRQGMAGERSGLFFEFARVADDVSSRWVLFENVPGLLSACSCPECNAPAEEEEAAGEGDEEAQRRAADRDVRGHRGHDFATVLGELTGFFPDPPDGGWRSSGFIIGPKRSAAWRVLDAQYFGVAQSRRRVFVVADSRRGSGPIDVLLEPESVSGGAAPRRTAGEGVASAPEGCSALGFQSTNGIDVQAQEEVSPPLKVGSIGGQAPPSVLTYRKAQKAHNPEDCERWEEADISVTLDAAGHGPRTAMIVMAPAFSKRPGQQIATRDDDLSYALSTGEPPRVLAFDSRTIGMKEDRTILKEGRPAPTLNSHAGEIAVVTESLVRRLTPLECERLQGFPDGWTDGQPDSPRYKQLGNAVAVPVVEWIARRISTLERLLPKD